MNNGTFLFTCMLCGTSEYIIRKGYARDNTTLIPLECASCGLVTLSSHTHIDNDFYAQSHMHDSQPCDPALELQQSAEDTERRYTQWKHLLAGKHVLDYGCGAGGFLLKARGNAASVTGIEPELRLQEHFAKARLPVYTSYEHLPKDTPFDVVTMFHVLEHVVQPLDILRQIRNGGGRRSLLKCPAQAMPC